MSNNDGMIFHCSLGDKIIGTNDGMESIKGRSQEKKFLYKKKGSHKPVINIIVLSIRWKPMVS